MDIIIQLLNKDFHTSARTSELHKMHPVIHYCLHMVCSLLCSQGLYSNSPSIIIGLCDMVCMAVLFFSQLLLSPLFINFLFLRGSWVSFLLITFSFPFMILLGWYMLFFISVSVSDSYVTNESKLWLCTFL